MTVVGDTNATVFKIFDTALKLRHLTYAKLLTVYGILLFFTNLSVIDFVDRFLGLFLHFSVIGCFVWIDNSKYDLQKKKKNTKELKTILQTT